MKVRRIQPICEATQWLKHGDHPAVRHDPDHPVLKAHGLDPSTHGILRTIAGHDFPIAPGYFIITLPETFPGAGAGYQGGGHYFHPPEAMRAYEVVE